MNFSQVLLGQAALKRETLYWHYPHYHGAGCIPVGAMRHGDWKLVHWYGEDRYELYNLAKDLSELQDVSQSKSEVLKELQLQWQNWLKSIPNIKYDNPNALRKK